MSENRFPIKGFKEGLLITLGEGDWKGVLSALFKQIDEKPDFYKGAKIAIDVGERNLRAVELGKLRDNLSERSLTLFAVITKSEKTELVAANFGLSTHKNTLKDKEEEITNVLNDAEKAILVRKTVRSGTSIKFPGHVFIDGDVNPGAEILAGGSVYVWGKLRGAVSAGIDGSLDTTVCALELNPSQLRIVTISKESLAIKLKIKKSPQRASINNGNIIISDWKSDNPLK